MSSLERVITIRDNNGGGSSDHGDSRILRSMKIWKTLDIDIVSSVFVRQSSIQSRSRYLLLLHRVRVVKIFILNLNNQSYVCFVRVLRSRAMFNECLSDRRFRLFRVWRRVFNERCIHAYVQISEYTVTREGCACIYDWSSRWKLRVVDVLQEHSFIKLFQG